MSRTADYLGIAHIGKRFANAPLTNGIALIWILANGSEADKAPWDLTKEEQRHLNQLIGDELVAMIRNNDLRGLATVVATVRFMQKPRPPVDPELLRIVEFVNRAKETWTMRELQRRLKAETGLTVGEKTLSESPRA